MKFKLDDELQILRKTVVDFATNEMNPYVDQMEENECLPEEAVQKIRKKAVEAGLNGMGIPEELGGAGFGALGIAIFSEAFRATTSCAMFTILAYPDPTLTHCTEEQKKRFLDPVVNLEKVSAFALTESEAGSDAMNIKTRAVKKGDRWVINGTKRFISHGPNADFVMVYAITDPDTRACTCFMVEKGTPGYSIGQIHKTMGFRGYEQSELIFEDCEVPEENILGGVNNGWAISNEWLSSARTSLAARCNGAAAQAIKLARDYAVNRVQFGQPIGDFQAIQFKLAECATELYASRWITYKTAWEEDQPDIAQDKRAMMEKSAMCKYYAAEALGRIADKCLQIHGGYGYTKDAAIERIYRDARIERIWEGSAEIMLRNVGRGLRKSGVLHF